MWRLDQQKREAEADPRQQREPESALEPARSGAGGGGEAVAQRGARPRERVPGSGKERQSDDGEQHQQQRHADGRAPEGERRASSRSA